MNKNIPLKNILYIDLLIYVSKPTHVDIQLFLQLHFQMIILKLLIQDLKSKIDIEILKRSSLKNILSDTRRVQRLKHKKDNPMFARYFAINSFKSKNMIYLCQVAVWMTFFHRDRYVIFPDSSLYYWCIFPTYRPFECNACMRILNNV